MLAPVLGPVFFFLAMPLSSTMYITVDDGQYDTKCVIRYGILPQLVSMVTFAYWNCGARIILFSSMETFFGGINSLFCDHHGLGRCQEHHNQIFI